MLAGIGLAVLAAAAVLFPARWGLRSFSITLAAGGLLELAIGLGLYFKTGPQVAKLVAQLGSDPAGLAAAEHARMLVVQRNFLIIELVWLALVGTTAAVAVWKKHHPLASGIALGLLVTASVILCFDIVAERRGKVYLDALAPAPALSAPASPGSRSPAGGAG